jgi:hypothetical protein
VWKCRQAPFLYAYAAPPPLRTIPPAQGSVRSTASISSWIAPLEQRRLPEKLS